MSRSTRDFPLTFTASGHHHLCAAQDCNGPGGTLVLFTWNGLGNLSAKLMVNTAAGIEPIALSPIGYVDRSTGYFVQPGNNNYLGETNLPFTGEVVAPNVDLYVTLALYGAATLTVVCIPAVQSTQRPAGASLFDLNFDQVPPFADEDLELLFTSAVANQTGQ